MKKIMSVFVLSVAILQVSLSAEQNVQDPSFTELVDSTLTADQEGEGDLLLRRRHHCSDSHKHKRKRRCKCPPGPTGPQGPIGPIGATGATGALEINFAAGNQRTQTIQSDSFRKISFDTDTVPPHGIVHDIAFTPQTFNILHDGNYRITWSFTAFTEPNVQLPSTTISSRLLINNDSLFASEKVSQLVSVVAGSTNAVTIIQTVAGGFTLPLKFGDTIELRVELTASPPPAQPFAVSIANAEISITQISLPD